MFNLIAVGHAESKLDVRFSVGIKGLTLIFISEAFGYRKFSKNSASLIIRHLLHYNEIISLKNSALTIHWFSISNS